MYMNALSDMQSYKYIFVVLLYSLKYTIFYVQIYFNNFALSPWNLSHVLSCEISNEAAFQLWRKFSRYFNYFMIPNHQVLFNRIYVRWLISPFCHSQHFQLYTWSSILPSWKNMLLCPVIVWEYWKKSLLQKGYVCSNAFKRL